MRGFPKLTDPIDAVVGLPELDQLREQFLVPERTGGQGTGLGGGVAARSHPQQSADELDSVSATIRDIALVLVDERSYFR